MLRKRVVSESEGAEEPTAVPTETTETDEELREAFEAVEQEKEVSKGDEEKTKEGEEEVTLQEMIPFFLWHSFDFCIAFLLT